MQEDLSALVTCETSLTILHGWKAQDDFQHRSPRFTRLREFSYVVEYSTDKYTQILHAKYESRIDTDWHRHSDGKKFLWRSPREEVNDTTNTSPMYITSMIYTSTHDRH